MAITKADIEKLEKQLVSACGKDVVNHFTTGRKGVRRKIEGVSTGSMQLNIALSGSPYVGFAWGRIVEIFGMEQSGKTTIALHNIHECQKIGEPAFFVDAEHALDPGYMEKIGIDLSMLGVTQPDCGEEAIEVTIAAVDAGYRVIVVDSVAALVPRAEIDGNVGDAHMGLQARLMGQAMRKLAGRVAKKKAIVIFINQIRLKIGMIFGNPETTTGGKALRFYASYRLDVRAPRGGAVTEAGAKDVTTITKASAEVGIGSNVKVIKNKVAPPYRSCIVPIRYGIGIDKPKDVVQFMQSQNMFVPTGKDKKLRVSLSQKKGQKSLSAGMLLKKLRTDNEIRKATLLFIMNKMERDSK